MANSEPFQWLPGISNRSRRFPPPVGATPLVQPRDPPGTATLSSRRASSQPPTKAAIPQERDTALTPRSQSSSSDTCSSTSYESSTSISRTHLHIGHSSIVPRFDVKRTNYPSSESDTSHVFDTRTFDPLESSWRSLEAKRDEVTAIRADILRSRTRAQKSRVRQNAADNLFMSFLRPLLLYNAGANLLLTSHARLKELFDQMQRTRNDCQDMESILESLEAKLGHAENQLDAAERELIHELRPGAAATDSGKPPSPVNRRASSPLPPLLLGIGAESPVDFHPLYKKFMSAVGYLQLAEEYHQDLLLRKESIERAQSHLRLARDYRPNFITTVNKQLEAQDTEFIRDFDLQVKQALAEIETLSKEVEALRKMCQERRVFPNHAPLNEAYSYEPNFGDDINLDSGPFDGNETGALFTSRFEVLLYSPNHLMERTPITANAALRRAANLQHGDPLYPRKDEVFASAAKEFLIEHLLRDANELDKTDFINRWLLQRLRTSAVEVELLYSLFLSSSSLTILDLDRWQQDVLFYWTRDEKARLPPEQYIGPITSECTQDQPVLTESSINPGL